MFVHLSRENFSKRPICTGEFSLRANGKNVELSPSVSLSLKKERGKGVSFFR
jgi:hypothetical protein